MTRKPTKPAKAPKKAPKSKAAPRAAKPAAKKTKKPEKPLPAKKAAAPAPKPAKAAAPRGGPAKPAKPALKAKPKEAKAPAPAGKKKPAVSPTGVAKPGLGHKWSCFNCGAKFYDLGKPVPVCPKCDADQRDRPPMTAEAAPSSPQPKRPAMAPMSRFLDDDEVAVPEPDEFGAAPPEADVEEPEAGEIDIESLEEPAGLGGDNDFTEAEEE